MRKPRPNTAEVLVRFRVPKAVTARDAKRLVWNHCTGNLTIYPDFGYEADRFGDAPIRPRAVSARIIREGAAPEVNTVALMNAVQRLYTACGDEGSEEAAAIAALPRDLNEALADVIRFANP